MPSLPMEWAKTPSGATSRTARFSIFVCFLVALIDGYDTLMLSFVAPLISREWACRQAPSARFSQ